MSEASFASLGPTLLARKGGAKPAMRPQLAPLPENSAEIAALADEQLEDLGWNDMGSESSATPRTDTGSLDGDAQTSTASQSDPEHDLIVSAAPKAALLASKDGLHSAKSLDVHPIVDPLGGADIVSLAQHKSKPRAANEDSLNTASPIVASQQKRLVQRIIADAAIEPAEMIGAAPEPLLRKKANSARTAESTGESTGELAQSEWRHSSKGKASSSRRAAFTLRLDTNRHLKLRLAATMKGVSAQSLVTQALDTMLAEIEELDLLVDRMKRD